MENNINRKERTVKVYTGFNRIWHWSQAISIFILLFTGLRVAGVHNLISFELAAKLHTYTALALVLLWIFIIFWLITTGSWRQYLPTSHGMLAVIRYYSFGVFKGESHPYHKVLKRRLNPLQAMAYFALNVFLLPLIWVTGVLYLTHSFWAHLDRDSSLFSLIANMHVVIAFAIAAFVVVHVYMLTFGHGFRAHIKAMITGFDKVHLSEEEEAYLAQNEPKKLKDDVT